MNLRVGTCALTPPSLVSSWFNLVPIFLSLCSKVPSVVKLFSYFFVFALSVSASRSSKINPA
jgi:hypothetical protein